MHPVTEGDGGWGELGAPCSDLYLGNMCDRCESESTTRGLAVFGVGKTVIAVSFTLMFLFFFLRSSSAFQKQLALSRRFIVQICKRLGRCTRPMRPLGYVVSQRPETPSHRRGATGDPHDRRFQYFHDLLGPRYEVFTIFITCSEDLVPS